MKNEESEYDLYHDFSAYCDGQVVIWLPLAQNRPEERPTSIDLVNISSSSVVWHDHFEVLLVKYSHGVSVY